jgi:hypothetical protein
MRDANLLEEAIQGTVLTPPPNRFAWQEFSYQRGAQQGIGILQNYEKL